MVSIHGDAVEGLKSSREDQGIFASMLNPNAVDLSIFELLAPPGAPFVGRSFGDSGL